jgi:hypothetical protein
MHSARREVRGPLRLTQKRPRAPNLADFILSQARHFLGNWTVSFKIVFVESRCIFWGFMHHYDVRHSFLWLGRCPASRSTLTKSDFEATPTLPTAT